MPENHIEENKNISVEIQPEEIRNRVSEVNDIGNLISLLSSMGVIHRENDPTTTYRGRELANHLNDAKVKMKLKLESEAIKHLDKITRSYGIRDKAAELLGIDLSKL